MLENHIKDPKTGFLTPKDPVVGETFNSTQKNLFLTKFSNNFNLSRSARLVGIPRSLVILHLKEDKAFKEAFDEVKEEVLDEIEENLYIQSKKSPIAAMQFLKAKRSAEWGPTKKVEHVDKTSEKLKALLENDNG